MTTQQQTEFAPTPRMRFAKFLYQTRRISDWHTTVYRAPPGKEGCPCDREPCECERDDPTRIAH